ncbi:MAG: Hsp70 family protein, partial [Chloroflexi bacterium]|nr:Hsp70 family protein [Chloroflexota bacterium]
SPSDIDSLLLTGGGGRIPLVGRALSKKLEREPTVCGDNAIAEGAAFYAASFDTLAVNDAPFFIRDESSRIPAMSTMRGLRYEARASERQPSDSATVSLVLKVHSAQPTAPTPNAAEGGNSSSQESAAADRERLFNYARRLIQQGFYDAAIELLQGLSKEAQSLLESALSLKKSRLGQEIEQLLRRGHELLDDGNFEQAVEHSHRAYSLATEDPDVFEEMIGIHCQAAMRNSSEEGYEKSMQWLSCILRLDRTNTQIHKHIAERNFLHAQQTSSRGDIAAALKALSECLSFNPEHLEAQALKNAISQTSEVP